jgi:excisionase family DNA binding protein
LTPGQTTPRSPIGRPQPAGRIRRERDVKEEGGMSAYSSSVLVRKWYSIAEVAELLGYGKSKVQGLVIAGELRSLKDGGSRRILPEWVDEYVARRAAEAEQGWV